MTERCNLERTSLDLINQLDIDEFVALRSAVLGLGVHVHGSCLPSRRLVLPPAALSAGARAAAHLEATLS